MAAYTIDPWGEQRADLRTAVLCATIANLVRSKGDAEIKPERFMLFPWTADDAPPGTITDIDAMARMLRGIAKSRGRVITAEEAQRARKDTVTGKAERKVYPLAAGDRGIAGRRSEADDKATPGGGSEKGSASSDTEERCPESRDE